MLRHRIIPLLLLKGMGFVKTTRFRDPVYLGDPVNILRIFNEKEVDELVILDIGATLDQKGPNYRMLEQLASECFMPLAYGGGLRTEEQAQRIFESGYEKVVLNTAAHESPQLITQLSDKYGRQSVLVSVDVRKNWLGGYEVMTRAGGHKTGRDPVSYAADMQSLGAGELLINSIDRDGTQRGYDLQLLKNVSAAVSIPVVACGGAGSVQDLVQAVKTGGASAAAAGSMFVFHGPHRAVLINVPSADDLQAAFAEARTPKT